MKHLRYFESPDISRVPSSTYLNAKTIHEDYEDSGLSKINLITFDGNQTKWEDFRDLFKSLVYDIDRISPTKKMQYLYHLPVRTISKEKQLKSLRKSRSQRKIIDHDIESIIDML